MNMVRHPGSLSKITAAILAGGLGTRLRSVVTDYPKVLVEVKERPFLTYLLEQLVKAEVRRVVLCTGYLADQVKEKCGFSYGPLSLYYSEEKTRLGTAGALKNAENFFESDTILVMNGDSYCNADIKRFWLWHCNKNSEGSIILTKASEANRYGSVRCDQEDMVVQFEEKESQNNEGWINAGIYLLNNELIQSIPDERHVSLEREMFPLWVSKGLSGYKYKGFFIDIGIPEDLEKAKTIIGESS